MLLGSEKKVIRGMHTSARSQIGRSAWGLEPTPKGWAGAGAQLQRGILALWAPAWAAASASERKVLEEAEGSLASWCPCPGW